MDCKDMEEYVFKHIGDISVYYPDRKIYWDHEKDFFCIRETSNSENEENAEDETTEEIYSTEEPSQEENVEQTTSMTSISVRYTYFRILLLLMYPHIQQILIMFHISCY